MLNRLMPLILALVTALPGYADEFYVIAHRGVVTDDFTENSLPSLEETIRRGYTHIEVDIRATRDGHAVCLHDRSLRRTLGIAQYIDELTLAEFRALVPEDQAPSFDTFCERSAGRIKLMPDVKSVPDELAGPFLQGIEDSLTPHGLMESALFIGDSKLIQHFHGKALLKWRDSLDEARQSTRAKDDPGRYFFVFNHGADFTQTEVDGFQAMGLKVIVSINTFHYIGKGDPIGEGLKHVEAMFHYGVDGLQIDTVYEDAVFSRLRAREE